MLTTAMAAVPFVLSLRERAKGMIEEVNQKCAELDLPPAFEVGSIEAAESLDQIYVKGNPDYRFEGFGIIIRFPPKLSFWVHYKKITPEHQALGKFKMDLKSLGDLSMTLLPSVGSIAKRIDQINDAGDLVQNLIEQA